MPLFVSAGPPVVGIDRALTNLFDDVVHDRIGLLQVGGEQLWSTSVSIVPNTNSKGRERRSKARTYPLLRVIARRQRPDGPPRTPLPLHHALLQPPSSQKCSRRRRRRRGRGRSCPEGRSTHTAHSRRAPQRRDRHGGLLVLLLLLGLSLAGCCGCSGVRTPDRQQEINHRKRGNEPIANSLASLNQHEKTKALTLVFDDRRRGPTGDWSS